MSALYTIGNDLWYQLVNYRTRGYPPASVCTGIFYYPILRATFDQLIHPIWQINIRRLKQAGADLGQAQEDVVRHPHGQVGVPSPGGLSA